MRRRRRPIARLFALATLLGYAACLLPEFPDQNDPGRFGWIAFALDPAWSAGEAADLRDALAGIRPGGPGVSFVEPGTAGAVAVDRCELPDDAAEAYALGSRRVCVDPANASRAGGRPALQRAAVHGGLHAYLYLTYRFAGHLCYEGDDGTDCHPVVRAADFQGRPADAVMLRGLNEREADGPGATQAYVPPVAEPALATADARLIAYCQAHPAGCL